jgi:hypothetical protein
MGMNNVGARRRRRNLVAICDIDTAYVERQLA